MKLGWAGAYARGGGNRGPLAVVLVLAVVFAAPATAQKKKKQPPEQSPSGQSSGTMPRLPDEQAIDLAISEMLGGWQLGNIEMLHKHYADDVMVVSGAWEPPLIGWNNYLQAYQKQRERMQGGRMDRSNTFIHVRGNFAWAVYQWDFGATVDGQPTGARGHTTLVFEKRGDRWLIVHNHTSIVSEARGPQPSPPAAPKPANSPGAGG